MIDPAIRPCRVRGAWCTCIRMKKVERSVLSGTAARRRAEGITWDRKLMKQVKEKCRRQVWYRIVYKAWEDLHWSILLFILSGKKYIFDIQRTFREAYDHARRQLYRAEIANHAEGSVTSNWESEVDSCQQQQCPDSNDYLVSILSCYQSYQ